MKRLTLQPPRGVVLSHLKSRVLLILPGALALMAAVGALTAGPASASNKEPKPGVSLSATPTTVPSGGTTTVTMSVFGAAKECELSGYSAAGGAFTVKFPCESGTLERRVTMPTNRLGRAVKYKLKFYAFSPGGRRSHGAKALIRLESTFTVEMLQRLEGEAAYTKENLRGKAPLTVEYEIVVSNTEEEVPVKVDKIEDSLVPGCATPPKQHEVKLGENGVVEATCSHTIAEPLQEFENQAIVRGKFFPHTGRAESSFEVERALGAETE